jgi:hypothetical protein
MSSLSVHRSHAAPVIYHILIVSLPSEFFLQEYEMKFDEEFLCIVSGHGKFLDKVELFTYYLIHPNDALS